MGGSRYRCVERLEPRQLLVGSAVAGPVLHVSRPVDYDLVVEVVDGDLEAPFEFTDGGFQWPQPNGPGTAVEITYSYSNLLDGQFATDMTFDEIRAATEEALGLWASVAPLHFVEVEDSGPDVNESNYSPFGHPQIRIGHHEFDSAFAHAYFPTGSGIGGDVHLSTSRPWDIAPGSYYELVQLITHEIGHSLGLGHAEGTKSVMYQYYQAFLFDGLGTGFLFQDDINGIRAIYGTGTGSVTPDETVNPVNLPPITFDAFASTDENTLVVIDLLEGDPATTDDDAYDPDGEIDRDSLVVVQTPFDADSPLSGTVGTVVIDNNRSSATYQKALFTPVPGFSGMARFAYNVRDLQGSPSRTTLVTVVVGEAIAPPPEAFDDQAATDRGAPVAIDILTNDTSAVGLHASSVQLDIPDDPSIGIFEYDNDAESPTFQQVIFTPSETAPAVVTFTYTVADLAQARSNTATVTVQVNVPPVAQSFNVDVLEDFDLVTSIVGSAYVTDIDGSIDASTLTIVAFPQHGVVSIDPETYDVTYSPVADFAGADSFSFYVRDDDGARSETATVHIEVIATDDLPRAYDDIGRTQTGESVVIDVTANDFDPDGQIVSQQALAAVVMQPAHGLVTRSDDGLSFIYTPTDGFAGADHFDYVVIDHLGTASNRATVHLRVGPPVAGISGMVYADTNNNGLFDSWEWALAEVPIQLTFTEGSYQQTQTTRTDINGQFLFVDDPTTNTILPPGEYALTEIPPALFVGGQMIAGRPAPALTEGRTFSGIHLASGEAATRFAMSHQSVRGDFLGHYASAIYFTSAELGRNDNDPFGLSAPEGLRLDDGDIWFSFDEGLVGDYVISAHSDDGLVGLDVYENDLITIGARADAAISSRIEFSGNVAPQFLKISGTGSDFEIRVEPVEIQHAPPVESISARLYVGSTNWHPTYSSGLDEPGYDLSAVAPTISAPLSWTGLDQVSLRFDRSVDITGDALRLSGRRGTNYETIDFVYSEIDQTATWTLAEPIAADVITLDLLNLEPMVEIQGSDQSFGRFEFAVLPADVDRNGLVNALDLVSIRRRFTAIFGDEDYSAFHDLDGNGQIESADFLSGLARQFQSLPSLVSAPLSPGAAAPVMANTVRATSVMPTPAVPTPTALTLATAIESELPSSLPAAVSPVLEIAPTQRRRAAMPRIRRRHTVIQTELSSEAVDSLFHALLTSGHKRLQQKSG